MLACIGDLVEDVVVRVSDPVNVASDTNARILRRRGGSAANVAAAAAEIGHEARFLGQIGADSIGAALLADLEAVGVDVTFVRRGGRTGTILVLVDSTGERTMLTDRAACSQLDSPDRAWLDGVTTLHVPMYSLVGEPLSATTKTVISWCHELEIAVSVDLSSTALIESFGVAEMQRLLAQLCPSVVFANRDEARVLGIDRSVGGSVTVVKRGEEPALVFDRGGRIEVPAESIGWVGDTTGAGDAFAAGFLTSNWQVDVASAARQGHRAAALTLKHRSTCPPPPSNPANA